MRIYNIVTLIAKAVVPKMLNIPENKNKNFEFLTLKFYKT